MKIVGITGGSGCGKSTIADIFKSLGAYVIDADVIARQVTLKGSPALYEIVEKFGKDILNDDDTLNRKKLGSIVFGSEDMLSVLNNIIHKYIDERILKEVDDAKTNKLIKLIVIDAAVLHKSKAFELCDEIIAVTCSRDLQIKRIMARDGIDLEQAEKRIGCQMTDKQYESLATITISSNQGKEKLREIVAEIYYRLVG